MPRPPRGDEPVRRARVLLNEPVGLLDYRVPATLVDQIQPGVAVMVPLRKRATRAYVAEVFDGPPPDGFVLKDITAIDPERPTLPPIIVELILFTADYYAAPPGEVLGAALPSRARRASRRYVITDRGKAVLSGELVAADRALLEVAVRYPKGFTRVAVERDLSWTRRATIARLRRQADKGWLTPVQRSRDARRVIAYRRLRCEEDPLTKRQHAIRALLEEIPWDEPVLAATLAAAHGGAYAKLKKLERLGLVERTEVSQRLRPQHEPDDLAGPTPVTPTPAQADALAEVGRNLDEGEFATFLLQGVTGSGKTEVYLRLIDRALRAGRTALVLVPEIALTPQLGARFRRRFGDRVATFHSGLTVAERRDEWERIAAGEAEIGLGARSALFLPLRNVGVIIVDEEHETSFKQDEMPRYNARDLAVYRGQCEGATVVLGSATPSLESRHNAEIGRYRRQLLPERVRARPMPEVSCIDMTGAERTGDGIFSRRLADEIEATLRADEQAILFLNRRGFAPYVYCRDCGTPFRCDDCDVALTLHRRRDRLLCHYCGFEMATPEECPACYGLRLEGHGLGTERLEAELLALFGDVAIARLDRDTIKRRTDLDRQLMRFRKREAQLLIGTQMVTKGHDFPGVTLVGIIAADVSLNFPDFRAAERTFQLLTQVSGRAGRGEKPGRVWVQTYEMEHYAIRAATRHDYEGFVAQELDARRELSYPPFSHLVLVRLEGSSEDDTRQEAEQTAAVLRERANSSAPEVTVLGPAAAPLARLRGKWRHQILLKGARRPMLREVLAALPTRGNGAVRRVIDVDPISML